MARNAVALLLSAVALAALLYLFAPQSPDCRSLYFGGVVQLAGCKSP